MNPGQQFLGYKRFLETLTLDSLESFRDFVSADVRFRDPFHDCTGARSMENILKTFINNAEEIQYDILEYACTDNTVFFDWVLHTKMFAKRWTISGSTRILFDQQGKVCDHQEYWDAASQVYEKMPFIGALLRLIRRKISAL
ncbi:MAG: nuclear transport factor 2 family protein [Pseudomonadota bacterium]|nr:nuclear transport factor 2 family protein [Pseudomonadota bacterium]